MMEIDLTYIAIIEWMRVMTGLVWTVQLYRLPVKAVYISVKKREKKKLTTSTNFKIPK